MIPWQDVVHADRRDVVVGEGAKSSLVDSGLPLYLSESDVEGLITAGEAVQVIEQCFLRMAAGEVENVPRRRLGLDDGAFAVMSAVDRELGYAGVKAYTAVAGMQSSSCPSSSCRPGPSQP